jgi:hypothetical protein
MAQGGRVDRLPSSKEFLSSLQARLDDAERLAKDARKRGDQHFAAAADGIAEEWRRLIENAGGKLGKRTRE